MSPIFEDECSCVHNGERWEELFEEHMETSIEEYGCETCSLRLGRDICRLFKLDLEFQSEPSCSYQGSDHFCQILHSTGASMLFVPISCKPGRQWSVL